MNGSVKVKWLVLNVMGSETSHFLSSFEEQYPTWKYTTISQSVVMWISLIPCQQCNQLLITYTYLLFILDYVLWFHDITESGLLMKSLKVELFPVQRL